MSNYISKQIDQYIRSDEVDINNFKKIKDSKLKFILLNIKDKNLSFNDLSEINKNDVEKYLYKNTEFKKDNNKLQLRIVIIYQMIFLYLVKTIGDIINIVGSFQFPTIYLYISIVFMIVYFVGYDVLIRYRKLNENFNNVQIGVLNFAIMVSISMYSFFSIIIIHCYQNRKDNYYDVITLVSLMIVVFFQWSFPEMINFILTSKENNNGSSKNINNSKKVQEVYISLNWLSTLIIGIIVLVTFICLYIF
ncbi:hypothetical protein [Staphylococcus hominis]|uniref:hypothetical protein n=1 Tax=Staphylococcus hominis TaxID=1290 RepID=UPI0034D77A80